MTRELTKYERLLYFGFYTEEIKELEYTLYRQKITPKFIEEYGYYPAYKGKTHLISISINNYNCKYDTAPQPIIPSDLKRIVLKLINTLQVSIIRNSINQTAGSQPELPL